MWHQVKSYGVENRAVAFLFSQFDGREELNMTDCQEKQEPVFLSQVDVDLQYPGTGLMYMGNNELESVMADIRDRLVDKKTGYVTKKRVYTMVLMNHDGGAHKVKERLVAKAKAMYIHLLQLAGGVKENMNQSFVDNLKRSDVRPCYHWIFPVEPSNSYDHEYSYFLPEVVEEIIQKGLEQSEDGKLQKDNFIKLYLEENGTEKFAEELWENLAGEGAQQTDADSMDMRKALKKYEDFRKEDPENDEEDDDAVIITPQGHKSQPKREQGGYGADKKTKEPEEPETESDKNKDEL